MKVDDDLARQVITPRLRESHKGSYGRVLLVGGLYPYGGAIIMAAIACVNSGAGLVTVATDRENITALHAHLPEAMAFDLRETERFLENLRAADVVLIGSGLGEDGVASQAMDLVLANLRTDQNLVVDGSFHGIVNQLLGPGLFQRVVQTGIPVKIDKSPCVHLGYDFLVNLPVIAIDAASGKPVKNRLYPGHFQNSPVSFLKIRQIAVPAFVEFLVDRKSVV